MSMSEWAAVPEDAKERLSQYVMGVISLYMVEGDLHHLECLRSERIKDVDALLVPMNLVEPYRTECMKRVMHAFDRLNTLKEAHKEYWLITYSYRFAVGPNETTNVYDTVLTMVDPVSFFGRLFHDRTSNRKHLPAIVYERKLSKQEFDLLVNSGVPKFGVS